MVISIRSHFIHNVYYKPIDANVKVHECILTSTPKIMNPNLIAEDLGNIKINLGNMQKCHPKYDQIEKSLFLRRMWPFRGGAEAVRRAPRWGSEDASLAPPGAPPQHTEHEHGASGDARTEDHIASFSAGTPALVLHECKHPTSIPAQAHLLPGASCLDRHLPQCTSQGSGEH